MSNKDWIMVDLETYSELPTAAIASIGAVKFNPVNRTLSEEFYMTVSPSSCKGYGLHFSASTLQWWKTQPYEARKTLTENNVNLYDALTQFTDWLGSFERICCWNMFDIPVLAYSYYAVGKKEPWNYYKTLECRTIADVYGEKIKRDASTHHNALEDAKTQAKFIIDVLNPLEVE
jgi:exodeoxyribonuclease VIII